MSRDTIERQMLRDPLRADIGAMIESLRTEMHVQFEGVQAQFDEVRGDIAKLDAKLERRTKTLGDALASLDKRLGDRLAGHETRLSRLEQRQPRR